MACQSMARAVPLYHHPIETNLKKKSLVLDISEMDVHFLFFTICGLSTNSIVSVFLATFRALHRVSSSFFFRSPKYALVSAVNSF